jgi:hypothetical protein
VHQNVRKENQILDSIMESETEQPQEQLDDIYQASPTLSYSTLEVENQRESDEIRTIFLSGLPDDVLLSFSSLLVNFW